MVRLVVPNSKTEGSVPTVPHGKWKVMARNWDWQLLKLLALVFARDSVSVQYGPSQADVCTQQSSIASDLPLLLQSVLMFLHI